MPELTWPGYYAIALEVGRVDVDIYFPGTLLVQRSWISWGSMADFLHCQKSAMDATFGLNTSPFLYISK